MATFTINPEKIKQYIDNQSPNLYVFGTGPLNDENLLTVSERERAALTSELYHFTGRKSGQDILKMNEFIDILGLDIFNKIYGRSTFMIVEELSN